MQHLTSWVQALVPGGLWLCAAILSLPPNAEATPLEQSIAINLSNVYQNNERRLATIHEQLEKLPTPYTREPTGTGGFLSNHKRRSDHEVVLTFRWMQSHRIDATALFPLRLFMGEIYDENLYWPKQVTIETEIDGSTITLAQLNEAQAELRQSLPEFVTFTPVETDNLIIRCTGLQKHPNLNWHAAGFAEIFIFSEQQNLAPNATLQTNGTRNGKYVLSSNFLTDNQTPLGLPQQAITPERKKLYFRQITENQALAQTPLTLTLHYAEPVDIDAVRIDPVNQHFYGQGFPKRFTIELLNKEGHILFSHNKYKRKALRNPALNPYIAHFSQTKASALRITALEAHQEAPPRKPTIELSEIAPLFRGIALAPAERIELLWGNEFQAFTRGTTTQNGKIKKLAVVNDGYNETGRILPQRAWAEGLHQRQQLMQEQLLLKNIQAATLFSIRRGIVLGSAGMVIIILGTAIFLIVRSRIKATRHVLIARAQIASDLHDDVGSNLGTIILLTERLQELHHTPAEQERLNKILRLTQESVLGLQEVLQTTAPEIGHPKNISTHLQELTSLMLGETSFTLDVGDTVDNALSASLPRNKFLLFYKESIHNAKKHAQCSRVHISLKQDVRQLILTIADDGIGIDKATLSKARTLRTLKKRAEWIGGELKIQSAPHQGTHLTLHLPLSAIKRNR